MQKTTHSVNGSAVSVVGKRTVRYAFYQLRVVDVMRAPEEHVFYAFVRQKTAFNVFSQRFGVVTCFAFERKRSAYFREHGKFACVGYVKSFYLRFKSAERKRCAQNERFRRVVK